MTRIFVIPPLLLNLCLLAASSRAGEAIPVTFRLTKPDAEQVFVAGSFNGWSPRIDSLGPNDGVWETELLLEPGFYYYKFVVDGEWISDPENPLRVNDGGSGFNSILKVGEPPGPQRTRNPLPLPRDKLPKPILTENSEWIDLYWFAWEILWSKIQEGTTENGFVDRYLDEGFNEQIYQWDTCFMALFAMYGRDVFPAMESLDNFYNQQREDGYIQRVYLESSGEQVAEPTSEEPLINPPLFAWVERAYVKHTGDSSRVRRVLPSLTRYWEWIYEHCRSDEGYGLYYNTPLGSGMDNTPRGDVGRAGWIDMSAQQALAAKSIASLAGTISDGSTSALYEARAQEIIERIDSLCWDEMRGAYFDLLPDGTPGPSLHLGSYWTLNIMDRSERVKQMIRHLSDVRHFARPHMLPTLSASSPYYNPRGHYWRGGVWAPTNYMVIRGLERLDYHDRAYGVAFNHLSNLSRVYSEFEPNEDSIAFEERYGDAYHTLWECYSPEYATPATRWDDTFYSRQDFVGWTGLGPIAMLLETIIGIEANAPDNEINWNLYRNDLHGVERFPFGTQKIDLLYNPLVEPPQIVVYCRSPFTLNVIRLRKEYRFEIEPGTHSFRLK